MTDTSDRAIQQDIERRVHNLQQGLDSLSSDDTSLATVRHRRNIEFVLRYYAAGGKPAMVAAGASLGLFVQNGAFISPPDPQNYQPYNPNNPILCEPSFGHHQLSL